MERTELSQGVFFNKITDTRFKKNCVSVFFISELDSETAANDAVVPRILTKENVNLPSISDISNRLSELYAADIGHGVGALGDSRTAEFSVTVLDDRYALEGENLLKEGLAVLLDCLFKPIIVDGAFKSDTVKTEKQSLIDDIEAELNEKRSYALNRARALLCAGEPAEFNPNGTYEQANNITIGDAFEAYRRMLGKASIEIISIGCNSFESVPAMWNEAFETAINRFNISREPVFPKSTLSPLKTEPAAKTEHENIVQSKAVYGFKPTSPVKDEVMTVFTKVFGGTPNGKLFLNVREKMSLCYYCAGQYSSTKGIVTVDCGVEKGNIDNAKAEILRQLGEISRGNVTDDEITQAKLSLENDSVTINDKINSLVSFYIGRIYKGEIVKPEEWALRCLKVTVGEVVSASQLLRLDSEYVLTN
ncbi:peptidase M16 [Clostridia bacterium]|nr:peptidase M16 [Clostridia bacterium]